MADDHTLVLTIFTFYVGIIVLMGLIGGSIQATQDVGTPEEPSLGGIISTISFFFSGIGFSLSGIPVWANLILFLPLGITILYILLKILKDLVPFT